MIEDTERQIDLDIPENERHPIDVRIEETILPVEAGGQSGEEEGIDTLRAAKAKLEEDLRTERAQRQQRESELAQNQSEVQRMREEGGRGQLQHHLAVIDGELHKMGTLADQAEAQYAQALQEGDTAKAAKMQRAMAGAEARLFALQSRKADVENRIKNGLPLPAEGRVPEPQQRPAAPADPVEAMIQGAGLNGRSAEWVRAHPEVASNPRLQARVGYAHQEALAEGHADGSDGYFAHVDKIMGFAAGGEPASAQPQRRPSAAAPVSPSSVGGGRPNAHTVRLTPEQREMAKISGITEAEYAKNLLKMQAADPSTRH